MLPADAFDTEELLSCLENMLHCQPVQIPVYDFKRHRRSSETFRKVGLIFTSTSHQLLQHEAETFDYWTNFLPSLRICERENGKPHFRGQSTMVQKWQFLWAHFCRWMQQMWSSWRVYLFSMIHEFVTSWTWRSLWIQVQHLMCFFSTYIFVKFTNPSILFGFAYLQIWVMPDLQSSAFGAIISWHRNEWPISCRCVFYDYNMVFKPLFSISWC